MEGTKTNRMSRLTKMLLIEKERLNLMIEAVDNLLIMDGYEIKVIDYADDDMVKRSIRRNLKKGLAIEGEFIMMDSSLNELEPLGLDTQYPVPSLSKYKFLIEQLYNTIWNVHSHDDYQNFVNITGQIINYYAKHPDVLRKEMPDIEWDLPLDDY